MVETQEIPEIVAALDAFVEAEEPYAIRFAEPLDLRALAGNLRLLPAFLDMGGCLGLRPNGDVALFLWDEPATLRPELDPRIRNLAYFQASLKFPALTPLVPQRTIDALICPHCSGSGKCRGFPADLAEKIVCYCGGLGWLPSTVVNLK